MELNPNPVSTTSEVVDGRVLHLLDPENLVGSPTFSEQAARRVRMAYEDVAPRGATDQLVISTSHHSAAAAWFAWPATARRLVRSGSDGADIALFEVLANEDIAARYDLVVIGSGDGIFALPAAMLQADGCPVVVVSRPESLSRQIKLAVHDIRYLVAPDPEAAAAIVMARAA